MTPKRLIQLPQELREIAVAGLLGGSLEGAAEGRHDARVFRGHVDPDLPAIHLYRRVTH